jgi:DNA-binding helix-hairpin-helix protein with protein kinase domain
MKEHKRKYEFETEVRVPGIEEIVRIANDFSDGGESNDKPDSKMKKSGMPSGEPKLDKNMSSMRNQMMKLAEAVAEDDQAVMKQINEAKEQNEVKTEATEPEVIKSRENAERMNARSESDEDSGTPVVDESPADE